MNRPSVAARIVYEFEHNVTEVHRRALEATLGIRSNEFDENIAEARDLGVDVDSSLRITPIYERDGWWTCRPTERIMAIAVERSLNRNLGEQARTARVLAGTKLDSFTRTTSSIIKGALEAYLTEHGDLLAISEQADYVIAAIEDALPRLFVVR